MAMDQVKVYKTDIENRSEAKRVLDKIRNRLKNYDVSLDLEDCDKVLRVESLTGSVDESAIKRVLHAYGHQIEKLP